MSRTQQTRQVILALLTEYRALDKPGHPDLLKIYIDNATDRIDSIYQVTDLQPSDPNTTAEQAKAHPTERTETWKKQY